MTNSTEQNAENTRSIAAAAVSLVSAVLAALLVFMSRKEAFVATYDKGLLAALLAVTIVAGSRALEGPGQEQDGRVRRTVPYAIQMSRSWLLCFIAIASVFILTEFIVVPDREARSSTDTVQAVGVTGTLRIETPTKTQHVQIVGRTGS